MLTVRFTGLENLIENFQRSPAIVTEAVQKALGHSLAEVEHQSKERTPVLTGYLQGSIGGEGGYSFIHGLSAGVGTNVVYALRQEMGDNFHHKTGEAHYMERGVGASAPFIKREFEGAMDEIAAQLTK